MWPSSSSQLLPRWSGWTSTPLSVCPLFLFPLACQNNLLGFFHVVLSDYYYPVAVVSVFAALVESLPLPDDNLAVYLAAFLPLYSGLV